MSTPSDIYFLERLPANNKRDFLQDAFEEYGLERYAYIRHTMHEGENLFTIHAADGTALVELGEKDAARAAIRQYELVPLSLH